MATDYAISRGARKCAATEEPFAPGDTFYSVLLDDGSDTVRRDLSAASWTGPPEGAVAWWRSQMPARGDAAPAPTEVLLTLLDEWADHPEKAAARYVLALYLVRRRVLRIETPGFAEGLSGEPLPAEESLLRVTRRGRAEPTEVPVATPAADEATAIQQQLADLLGAA